MSALRPLRLVSVTLSLFWSSSENDGALSPGLSGMPANLPPGGMSRTGRIPTVRVTEKGQVTIPKELRDALGIGAGTEVEFERRRDTIVVRKAKTARGDRVAARLRGRGDVAMSTDEIMALTRAD